jgi:hypothetical protein
VTERSLAYLEQGKLHLFGGGSTAAMESPFGRSLRERAAQIHNRNAWKMQGHGAQFMRGMLWPAQAHDPGEFRIAITSIARGRNPGEVFYSLETDEISGVFTVQLGSVEQRLFHTADFRVRHIAVDPQGRGIAVAVLHPSLTANIAVLDEDGSAFQEVSEGDSVDLAPRWAPGPGRRLVFQSAGLGRDGAGRYSGVGPFAVHRLDLDSGELECLAEEPDSDLLAPQADAEGTLYYIRRPYASQNKRAVDPFGIIKDTLLFPFRMAFAIFQFFNFFSMRYTGKPLSNSKGGVQNMPDLRQMMLRGNLTDAMQEGKAGEAGAVSKVPSSWQLVRQSPDTKEILAKGVLSFDFARDGSVLYSNGTEVHKMGPNGGHAELILAGTLIEQVAAL